jgi:hypothetical protein
MAHTCEGCGERASTYTTAGAAAGRWLCLDCRSRRKQMTRLSWLVAFRYRVAEVLPPGDQMTGPILRLMMAVDDVRRAHINFIEASQRLADPEEAHRVLGDYLYALRLLCSHLHEAGHALRQLDAVARDASGQNRVSALLAGNRPGTAALKKVRQFFSSQGYLDSLVYRVRNLIGSHYDEGTVAALVANEFTAHAELESTAASVGGLARMADPLVWNIMKDLNGGDFMTDETQTQKVKDAFAISNHLINFVDQLFATLVEAHMPAVVVTKRELTVRVPPLVVQAGEAVDADRARQRAEQRGDTAE